MKCSGCGTELGPDVAFCPKCGTKAGAAPLPSDARSAFQAGGPSGAAHSDEETKLWEGGYSGKAMVGSWFLALLATIGLGTAIAFWPEGTWILVGLIGAIWLFLILVLAVRKLAIHYELTTQRFIHQSGILTRTSDRIEVIDIDDVTFQQGVVERMFNVGSIKLSSSDRTHPELHLIGIDQVKVVADTIDDARRKERRRRGVHIENI